jgi:hypothetical protein
VLQGGACGYSAHCDASDFPDILYSDTWTLDGTDWTPLSLTSPPDAGYSHLMTYDASAAEVVLVTYTWYPHVQKTWRLAGSAWTRCADAGMPGERTPLQVTWDGIRSRLLGFVDDHWDSPQLWALEAGEWFSLALPAGPSSSAAPVGFTRDAAGRPVLLTYDDRLGSPWETWGLRSDPLHP